jgi:hypothetical protein
VRIFAQIALACGLASVAGAQQIRGTITDSTTRQTVSGAIVMLLDSAGTSVARTIADETGAYVLPFRDAGRRLRVQRLGFRPAIVPLPAPRGSQVRVDIAILPIATYLQAVSVSASACSSRPDRGSAIGLFDQARTGLLATVVAREANPARMVLYGFERIMDGTSNRIVRQTVRVDSAASARVSFSSAITGKEMVESGFVRETQWGRVFLAPDADALLGDDFATGYCFSLAKAQPGRPNQLGIAFEAADSKRDRVDIEGALWLDTLKRALVDLEFNYVNLGRRVEMLRPGGRVEFREMPNGAVLVDRWTLRLIGSTSDSIALRKTETAPEHYQVLTKNYVTESGGVLAHARWRDGRSWRATLGRLQVQATLGDKPATGAVLALDETPYRGTVDAAGMLDLSDIVPGPYKMVVLDPALAEVEVTIPTPVAFTATLDSTHRAQLAVPTARDFIHQRCVADKFSDQRDSTRILVRAMTHTGEPLGDVSWKVSRRVNSGAESGTTAALVSSGGHLPMMSASKVGPGVSLGAFRVLRDGGRTGTDGMFQLCVGGLYRGTQLLIQASRSGYEDVSVEARLTGALQVVRLNLVPRQ